LDRKRLPVLFFVLFFLSIGAVQQDTAADTDGGDRIQGKIGGCRVLPANNIWNTRVDTLPVDANSNNYIAAIGASSYVHADFGSGLWDGGPIGIPFVTVPGTQARVDVYFLYDDESDPGPYPVPPDAPIEGGSSSDGDRHVLVLDRDNCILYELYRAFPRYDGGWDADSGAIFDLKSNALRPAGWTSADAAGLPILPGLVRCDEVTSGEINHAIRFTAPQTRRAYIWPARHYASSLTGNQYPPMGQRFRLKANFVVSGFSPQVQVILKALKKYGMILADNGSAWFISGVPDERWNNDMLRELHNVRGSDFEAVDESSLMVNPNSGEAIVPVVVNRPEISLDRVRFNAGAVVGGPFTGPQTFLIGNSGTGTLHWTVAKNAGWLGIGPASGTGPGVVTVSLNPSGLSPGTYTGMITVSDPNAVNSPQTVTVNLSVKDAWQDQPPFGSFDTPMDNSTVRSSIPVTGWALDDVEVERVKIYRRQGSQPVFIGDAVLVEGARPDVETAYPDYPGNYQAGWGYMMLTNFLPDGGNGTFQLYAAAEDVSGNEVSLGTKTIICDNANAVKPFGAIDTPAQGGTASGSNFINWGWVLTPRPDKIPTNGSTINVWVDGVNIGHPVYNNYRADIAGLFPGYANSDGAVGYLYLDTTSYENGVHTIQWTATDTGGNTDGIGSRYFTIQNSEERTAQGAGGIEGRGDSLWSPGFHGTPVKIIKGYNRNVEPQSVYPDESGDITIEIEELERLEIHFHDSGTGIEEQIKNNSTFNIQNSKLCAGYLQVGSMLRRLPIGSTFDIKAGTFSWQPGPGFSGEYRLVFLSGDKGGSYNRKNVTIRIVPKSREPE
jgi:hypothetical protein